MNKNLFFPLPLLFVSCICFAQHNEMHNHNNVVSIIDDGLFGNIVIDFELIDHNGTKVSIEDFSGQFLFIGFGFTNCPNVCPMMAFNIGNAVSSLGEGSKGIFISVDSERDTPEITHNYASNFGANMIGLSGSFEEINLVANNFNVSYAITKTQNNYTVQHTSNIYIVDQSGDLLDILPFSSTSNELIESIYN